jgi:ABC-2 type transport system permease protein
MRKIWTIAWNDLRIEFSERSTLIFFLLLPVVFTAVLGISMSGNPDGDRRFALLVVDEDETSLAAELGQTLAESQVVRPVFRTRAEADALFAEKEAPALLMIPAGFSASLLAGEPVELSLRIQTNDTGALAIEQALRGAVNQVSNAVTVGQRSVAAAAVIQPFADDSARSAYFEQAVSLAQIRLQNPPAKVEASRATVTKPQIATGFEQASAGQLVTWVLITLVGAADVFVSERVGGTLRRLLITPTRKATVILGKISGRLAMGITQMTLLIGVGALLFGVNWGRSPLALTMVVLAFALAAVAFGVLLATIARTREQVSGLTLLSAMLMAALGGAWWPLEITPPLYQQIVQVLPTTWAMRGFTGVIVRGYGVTEVLPFVAILIGFALLFFTLGVWRLRYE